MKAAVLIKPKELIVKDVPKPDCGDDELLEEFNRAYDLLKDKLYDPDGLGYSDVRGTGAMDNVRINLIDLKKRTDDWMKGTICRIYKHLGLKYDK